MQSSPHKSKGCRAPSRRRTKSWTGRWRPSSPAPARAGDLAGPGRPLSARRLPLRPGSWKRAAPSVGGGAGREAGLAGGRQAPFRSPCAARAGGGHGAGAHLGPDGVHRDRGFAGARPEPGPPAGRPLAARLGAAAGGALGGAAGPAGGRAARRLPGAAGAGAARRSGLRSGAAAGGRGRAGAARGRGPPAPAAHQQRRISGQYLQDLLRLLRARRGQQLPKPQRDLCPLPDRLCPEGLSRPAWLQPPGGQHLLPLRSEALQELEPLLHREGSSGHDVPGLSGRRAGRAGAELRARPPGHLHAGRSPLPLGRPRGEAGLPPPEGIRAADRLRRLRPEAAGPAGGKRLRIRRPRGLLRPLSHPPGSCSPWRSLRHATASFLKRPGIILSLFSCVLQ